jgi:hypothetical protein
MNPFDEITDLVGARVVALFLSDLKLYDQIIRSTFDVIDFDDKVAAASDDTFGYMSVHYICRLGTSHAGPRYAGIGSQAFEVQLRTIVMDAWANVSHHLAYTTDSSIPSELRRDFFALSGLFYVADQHFELFFHEAIKRQTQATSAIAGGSTTQLPLDLETVTALLEQLYPARKTSRRSHIAELLKELESQNYTTLDELERALRAATPAAEAYERDYPPVNTSKFSALGITRVALGILNFKSSPGYRTEKYSSYRHLLPATFRKE